MQASRQNIVTFRLEGADLEVDLYGIDGIEWRDAKRASGYPTQMALVTGALEHREFDAAAALVWIVWRRSDPDIAYLDVMRRFTYAAVLAEEEPSSIVNGSEPNSGANGLSSLASTGSGPGRSPS